MRVLHRVSPFVFVIALACGQPASESGPAPGTVLGDVQLVDVDAAVPSYDFAGRGAILLGDGWGRTDRDRRKVWFSWALDGRAVIDVPRPVRPLGAAEPAAYDFVAEVMPFAYDGRPAQRLSLWRDETSLAEVALEDGWQTVRLALPANALPTAWNRLELRFSGVARPKDVGRGADTRPLSAGFRWFAFVPRDQDEPTALRARLNPNGDAWSLAPGAALAIPVAAQARVTVALDRLQADDRCGDCTVSLRFARGDENRTAWQGPLADAPAREVIETPSGALGQLRIVVESGPSRGRVSVPTSDGLLATEVRASGTVEGEQAPRPPIFVYLIDTLRADALSPFGGDPEVSPETERFAGDAVTYRQAWSASAWTLPSTISILTGVYSDRHGVMTGRVSYDAAAVPPLAARLADVGYASVGLSHSLVASARFGLDAGFDHFTLQDQLNGPQLGSGRLRRHLVHWLSAPERREQPVFGYLHSVDPHAPYTPEGDDTRFATLLTGTLPDEKYHPVTFIREDLGADPRDNQKLRAFYDGEVAYTDRQLGRFLRLLKHLGLYDRSVVVVVSDHGEEFAEHAGYGHGRTLYEEQLRVPLMIKYPEQSWGGTRIDRPVSTVDIVPTVLQVVGAAGGTQLDGHSLLPPDLEATAATPRPLLSLVAPNASEDLAGVDYRAFRIGDVKCVESRGETDQFGQPAPPWQAFDLATDPGEQAPLADDDPRATRCRRLLERWMTVRAEATESTAAGAAVDPETIEQLKALGYLGG